MKKFFVLFLAMFAFSCVVTATEKKEPVKKLTQEDWNKKMSDSNKDSWHAQIRLMYKGTPLPHNGIMFAIVKKDPMENYKEELKKMKNYILETADLKDLKASSIDNSWNDIFDTVTGNQMSFLENDVKDRYHHMLGSNDFSKQWLVTKGTVSNGNVIALWSIPVQMKKGETIDVTLTEKNMVSNKELYKIYDSIIK